MIAHDLTRSNTLRVDAFQSVRDAVEGHHMYGGNGVLLNPRRLQRAPSDRSQLELRLETVQAESQAVADALARLSGSKDARAPAARSTLTAAAEALAARVNFLEGFRQSYETLGDAFATASADARDAEKRLQNCDPSDAAKLTAAVAGAEAQVRVILRAGRQLVDDFKATAAPVLPELAQATERAARVQDLLDQLRIAAQATGPLDVACEGSGEHWALIAKQRAKKVR